MSVNRHWENEDIMWVYKNFCIDVGRWAMHTWYFLNKYNFQITIIRSDFRELEYREWVADMVVLVATRRNEHDHDTKLISLILDELCQEWDYEKSDYLGFMINQRMQRRRLNYLGIILIFIQFSIQASQ